MIINNTENNRLYGVDYAFNGVESTIAALGVPRSSRTMLQLATPLVPAVLAVVREASAPEKGTNASAFDRNWKNVALPIAAAVLGIGILAFTKFATIQKRT